MNNIDNLTSSERESYLIENQLQFRAEPEDELTKQAIIQGKTQINEYFIEEDLTSKAKELERDLNFIERIIAKSNKSKTVEIPIDMLKIIEKQLMLAEKAQIKEDEDAAAKEAQKSPFKNFVQKNSSDRATLTNDQLMVKNLTAARIFNFLTCNMDRYNAVMVSNLALMEYLEVSRSSVSKGIKFLKDCRLICVYKSGTSNIYALDDTLVWNSRGTNRKFSKFNTNIIISKTEQEQEYLESLNYQDQLRKDMIKSVTEAQVREIKKKFGKLELKKIVATKDEE